MKKFELTSEQKINWFGHTLYRIKACISFTTTSGDKVIPTMRIITKIQGSCTYTNTFLKSAIRERKSAICIFSLFRR